MSRLVQYDRNSEKRPVKTHKETLCNRPKHSPILPDERSIAQQTHPSKEIRWWKPTPVSWQLWARHIKPRFVGLPEFPISTTEETQTRTPPPCQTWAGCHMFEHTVDPAISIWLNLNPRTIQTKTPKTSSVSAMHHLHKEKKGTFLLEKRQIRIKRG